MDNSQATPNVVDAATATNDAQLDGESESAKCCREAEKLINDHGKSGTTSKTVEALLLRAVQLSSHTEAAYMLGDLYARTDIPAIRDGEKAVRYLEQAVDAGCARAMFRLACVLDDGADELGVPQNLPRVMHLYNRLVDSGNDEAMCKLASIYESGDEEGGVPKDFSKAVSLLRRSADAGNSDSMFSLGVILQLGEEPSVIQKDEKEAVKLFRRAVDKGHTEAAERLALYLENGDDGAGVERDVCEAVKLFRLAAHDGHRNAMFYLADYLEHGNEEAGVQQDLVEAFAMYRSAADLGHVDALYYLAEHYETGNEEGNIDKDHSEAVLLYRRAIDTGHVESMCRLASILEYGREQEGVQQDIEEAVRLFTLAADSGSTVAMVNLANMLMRGSEFLAVDAERAESLYKKAIHLGHFNGYGFLGIMYQRGSKGLRINPTAAFEFFSKGWTAGDNLSGYLLADMLLSGEAPVGADPERARNILENIVSQESGCAAVAAHELAVLLERGSGSVHCDVVRAAKLHCSVDYNPQSELMNYGFITELMLSAGSRYPALVTHVLENGKVKLKKCLLLTLGGGSRGKTSTVRSMKRQEFVQEHIITEMADFVGYVSTPGLNRLDDSTINDLDFNDSSLQSSVYRAGTAKEMDWDYLASEISSAKPFSDQSDHPKFRVTTERAPRASSSSEELNQDDDVCLVRRNGEHKHRDVIERVRRSLILSEYGAGFPGAAVHVWDMAGQYEYEMAHSLFVQRANILVFVTNLARVWDEDTRSSEVELLCYWMQFAFTLVPDPRKVSPIIVATQRDCCGDDSDSALRKLYGEITFRLGRSSPLRKAWLPDTTIDKARSNVVAIDNSVAIEDPAGSGLDRLEQVIQSAADKIVHEREETPIRWLAFLDKLERLDSSFFNRKRVQEISEEFPGFSEDPADREKDILVGFRSLASVGKLVLFEISELEWYVFLDVQRIVSSVGSVIAANDNLGDALADEEAMLLRKGIISRDVLFDLWSHLDQAEKEAMLKLLVKFDLLMSLHSPSDETELIGVPALFDVGASGMTWTHKKGEKDLHVTTKFDGAIPAGIVGRLMAYLHRELSDRSPPATLVRRDAALVSIAGLGRVFVIFDRVGCKLDWVFRSKSPVRGAHKCLGKFRDLFAHVDRKMNVKYKHFALFNCSACNFTEEKTVSLQLKMQWLDEDAVEEMPQTFAFCKRNTCMAEYDPEMLVDMLQHEQDKLESARESLPSKVVPTDVLPRKPYDVFISHAGPDKMPLAEPLYRALKSKGLHCFLDFEELASCGQTSYDQMDQSMNEARIGLIILSPEFATRKWPMRELGTFLRRHREGGPDKPVLVPVFYRLTTEDCKAFYSSWSLFAFWGWNGKFEKHLKESTFVNEHHRQNGGVSQLQEDLAATCSHTGVPDVLAGGSSQISQAAIMQNTVENVLDAMRRLKLL